MQERAYELNFLDHHGGTILIKSGFKTHEEAGKFYKNLEKSGKEYPRFLGNYPFINIRQARGRSEKTQNYKPAVTSF